MERKIYGSIDINTGFSYYWSMNWVTGKYKLGLLCAAFVSIVVNCTPASGQCAFKHTDFLTYGMPGDRYYFALNLAKIFNSNTSSALGQMKAAYWFPDINSREYELGYGMHPPSVAEQLLYSVGMVLLQTGAQRLEAHTRGY